MFYVGKDEFTHFNRSGSGEIKTYILYHFFYAAKLPNGQLNWIQNNLFVQITYYKINLLFG